MEFVYTPPSRLGDISAGMSQQDVRAMLDSPFKEFQKSAYSKSTTDDFRSHGIHVYYDEHRLVKGVELFCDAQLIVSEVPVLGRAVADVVNDLKAARVAGEQGDSGWAFFEGALRLWADEGGDDDQAIVESAYVALRPES